MEYACIAEESCSRSSSCSSPTSTLRCADGVDSWINHENGVAEISDFGSKDYPNLRQALSANKASYRFHVIDTLSSGVLHALHSMVGLVTHGGEHGIDDEQIRTLIAAPA